jgi:hypothetical protein
MVFIVKDLLVSVLVSDEREVATAGIHPTTCFLIPPGRDLESIERSLETLKRRLLSALREIDREEQTIGEHLRPRTLEEIDKLQQKFDQAQAELDRLRAEIPKET